MIDSSTLSLAASDTEANMQVKICWNAAGETGVRELQAALETLLRHKHRVYFDTVHKNEKEN